MALTTKEISEGIREGKKLKITRYIKEVNDKRIERGISDIIINLNWKWDELNEKSLTKLKELRSNTSIRKNIINHLKSKGHEVEKKVLDEAFDELINSTIKSLNTPYDPQKEKNDKYIYHDNNIKENKETGDIYLLGLKHLEIETKSPIYKETKSKPKTIIKNMIKEQLPNNVKNYKLKKEELAKVKLL